MRGISLMSAEQIGRAAEFDPQFALPAKPRFSSDFQIIPMEGGILVHGGESLQVLRGNAATQFLPFLLPLLDGTRTEAELIAQFPQYPAQSIKNVIALLYARGLLEDGAGDEGVDLAAFAPEVLSFFRRHTDATRVNRSAGEGLARLQQARLLLLRDGAVENSIAQELGHIGAGKIREQSIDDPFDPGDATFVLVFSVDQLDHEKLSRLDRVCGESGIPWMLSHVSGGKAMLGPYFERGETACYSCFQAAWAEWETDGTTLQEHKEMWEQYTVLELSYFLSRLVPAVTGLDMITFDFSDWSKTNRRVARRPGCPDCHPLPGLEPVQPELAVRFDQSIAFPSRHLLNPKDHQVHYRTSNLELALEAKNYPSAPQIHLPKDQDLEEIAGDFLSGLFQADKQEPSTLTVSSVGRLLVSGAGVRVEPEEKKVRKNKNQRWAPTGGNLGSAQIYVWNRSVEGLAESLYFYQPNSHTLARVGPQRNREEVEEAIVRATNGKIDRLPDALLVLTGAFARVASKYNAFAYRIIHLDAGVAVAQMKAAAAGLGLRLNVLHEWNEPELAALMGIDKLNEPVTVVCTLSSGEEKQ